MYCIRPLVSSNCRIWKNQNFQELKKKNKDNFKRNNIMFFSILKYLLRMKFHFFHRVCSAGSIIKHHFLFIALKLLNILKIY